MASCEFLLKNYYKPNTFYLSIPWRKKAEYEGNFIEIKLNRTTPCSVYIFLRGCSKRGIYCKIWKFNCSIYRNIANIENPEIVFAWPQQRNETNDEEEEMPKQVPPLTAHNPYSPFLEEEEKTFQTGGRKFKIRPITSLIRVVVSQLLLVMPRLWHHFLVTLRKLCVWCDFVFKKWSFSHYESCNWFPAQSYIYGQHFNLVFSLLSLLSRCGSLSETYNWQQRVAAREINLSILYFIFFNKLLFVRDSHWVAFELNLRCIWFVHRNDLLLWLKLRFLTHQTQHTVCSWIIWVTWLWMVSSFSFFLFFFQWHLIPASLIQHPQLVV